MFIRIRCHEIQLIYLARRNRLATGNFLASEVKLFLATIILESFPCVTDALAILARFISCPVAIRRWVTIIPPGGCMLRSCHFVQAEPVIVVLQKQSVQIVFTSQKKFTRLKSATKPHIAPNFATTTTTMTMKLKCI